jgi:beta-lactamase regulating signal transducer with metallopeptidase domain
MRLLLGVIVSGAAATVILLVASLVAAGAWRIGARYLSRLAPRNRARVLACWRLFPSALAGATAMLALVAFLRFEPAYVDEQVGALLPLFSAAGIVSAAASLYRLARAWRQTARSLRTWRAERAGVARALPILAVDAPFPVVAVVGIWQPRLYVARQVVERCDSRELDAIIAHEAEHVRAHDNLTRLLFVGAPAVPWVSRINTEIERAWIAAAEDAADDAARRDERSAMALASALTKVARMATSSPPLLHASAILSGSGVEHRIRRLLEPTRDVPQDRSRIALPLCVVTAAVVALSTPVLRSVYELAEYCVRNLP